MILLKEFLGFLDFILLKQVFSVIYWCITKVVFLPVFTCFHVLKVDLYQQVLGIKAVIVERTVSNRVCTAGIVEQPYDRINRYALKAIYLSACQ